MLSMAWPSFDKLSNIQNPFDHSKAQYGVLRLLVGVHLG
jgi:hypothetical protein